MLAVGTENMLKCSIIHTELCIIYSTVRILTDDGSILRCHCLSVVDHVTCPNPSYLQSDVP